MQQCFEHGMQEAAQGNYDYATELLSQCVQGDPGNVLYLQGFFDNLHRKYGDKKRSPLARFKERAARAAFKKSIAQGKWGEVIKHGLAILRVDPWDVSTLLALATATEGMVDAPCGLSASPLVFLRFALEADPKSPDVNRLCGIVLGRRGQFDQAIACWRRVEQISPPHQEEAQRAIADLAVRKAAHRAENDATEDGA